MAARPSSLVSSGKAWGGSRKGVGRCRGQTDPSPPAALAAMGPGLLFPLLLLEALGAPGSELDAGGRHVCKASRWVLWESDEGEEDMKKEGLKQEGLGDSLEAVGWLGTERKGFADVGL